MFSYLCLMLPLAVLAKSIGPQAAPSISMPICETKEDCNLWETPTISDCVDGLCHCTGGSDYSEKKKGCECPEGLVIGKSKCIEVQNTPGGLCEENIQCNNGTLGNLAVCDRKQCHCSKGSVLVNEVCRQKKNPSQDCEYDGECSHIDNFACLDKVCACKEGYVINEDDNTCFKKLQSMWSPCIHDLQCIKSFGEGTVCRTKCICKSDYQPVDNVKCVKTKTVPGVECSSSSECNEEDTICVEGKCLKKDGHSKLSSSTSAIILMLLIYFILTANRRVT